jgi:hypothetical protein
MCLSDIHGTREGLNEWNVVNLVGLVSGMHKQNRHHHQQQQQQVSSMPYQKLVYLLRQNRLQQHFRQGFDLCTCNYLSSAWPYIFIDGTTGCVNSHIIRTFNLIKSEYIIWWVTTCNGQEKYDYRDDVHFHSLWHSVQPGKVSETGSVSVLRTETEPVSETSCSIEKTGQWI